MSRAISKRLACIEPGTLFVGADLSLDDSVAVVVDGRAKQLRKGAMSPVSLQREAAPGSRRVTISGWPNECVLGIMA